METADGRIYLLDFDTICVALRMFDVMVMCDMTGEELAAINDWIVIRHFQLQATIVELFGMDCIDNNFVDKQLQWIKSWEEQLCVKP